MMKLHNKAYMTEKFNQETQQLKGTWKLINYIRL